MGFCSQNHFLNITVSLILFSYILTVSVTILIVLIYKSITSNLSFWLICLIVSLICLPGCPTGTLKLSSWSLLRSSSTTFLHLLIIPVCSISKSRKLRHSSFLWCYQTLNKIILHIVNTTSYIFIKLVPLLVATALVQANIVSFLDYDKRFLSDLPETNLVPQMPAAIMPPG